MQFARRIMIMLKRPDRFDRHLFPSLFCISKTTSRLAGWHVEKACRCLGDSSSEGAQLGVDNQRRAQQEVRLQRRAATSGGRQGSTWPS